jgi:asparagine synthase (glutamine-hydrolysing)
MCGIAGFIEKSANKPERTLKNMTDAIASRGPDGQGHWDTTFGEWIVALGHRRLSIIDLEGGMQPLGTEDALKQISFNGEIYNFKELRQALEKKGHRFQTRSDTEVALHQYLEHGVKGLAELDGMFAFALWDSTTGELLLVRDRVGIKPLYYATLPRGGVVFGSELSPLLAHPSVPRKVSTQGIASYFFSDYSHPPETAIEGVQKLEPGHYVIWNAGKLSDPQPYWTLNLDAEEAKENGESHDVGAAAQELWQRLSGSVERAMISDVPVGVFLSGGLDSSIVAALARERSYGRLRTFSIGFENSDYDESPFAREVAKHLGSEHTEEILNESSLLEIIDPALDYLDEPLGDPSYLPTYLLSRLAARHVKVVLGGDGGDELWAGYPTYFAHKLGSAYAHLPRVIRENIIEEIVSRIPVRDGYQTFEWKAKRFALRWDDHLYRRHLRWMSAMDLSDVQKAMNFEDASREPATLSFASLYDEEKAKDQLNSILALDLQTYLPGSVLTKVDRASMAHSLEVRPPLLGNESVDWAFRQPSALKLHGRTKKFLLKKAAEGHLPDSIIHREKKGFAIPLSVWLRGPLKTRLERLFTESPLWSGDFLNRTTFLQWNEEHQNQRVDRSKALWALFVLDHWARRRDVEIST